MVPRSFAGALAAAAIAGACDERPPYPPSPAIAGLTWDATATLEARGSDGWVVTWADDGHLYAAYGDGPGFGNPTPARKVSLGWARIEGPGDRPRGYNIPSPDEELGEGPAGKKASGMVCVRGTLYMAVRNADRNGHGCEIWSSTDHGRTWSSAGWQFAELGYGAFLNFGRGYAGARDDHVYMYSPDTPSAYVEADAIVLARVHKRRILEREAWEFFAGWHRGEPVWSREIDARQPVFRFRGGCNRLDVTYVAGLSRYLMTLRARSRARFALDHPNHFSIYDAPEPWGPWTTVYYAESSLPGMSPLDRGSGGWGESQHIPAKWITPEGTRFCLIYSGDDALCIRGATVHLRSGGPGG